MPARLRSTVRWDGLFATDEIWPSARFFSAKVDEQRKRHDRYQDVDYNLEPNIKVAPGGLRDIQTVGWIIKRHFGNTSQDDLTARGFLTAQEGQWLHRGPPFPVARALRPASDRRPAPKTDCCSTINAPLQIGWGTQTATHSSASNNSCTTTTGTC